MEGVATKEQRQEEQEESKPVDQHNKQQAEPKPMNQNSEQQEEPTSHEESEQPEEAESKPVQEPVPRVIVKHEPELSPALSMAIITPHQSAFAQMESVLALQLEKCYFYKTYFERQGNISMVTRFSTLASLTSQDLSMLRSRWDEGGDLPKFKFDYVKMNCMPTNIDIKEKELQIAVKTSNLPVAENSMTYIIAEFEFPVAKEETLAESIARWLHLVKIEPKNLFYCTSAYSRQLDIIYSTNIKPFFDPDSKLTEYDRALQFYVDKGKSRTLKRKFKPVKLTFYERTSFFRCDKQLGTAQIKVDAINEDVFIVSRSPIMNGRKQTEAFADIKVRVREPLVDKTVRAHKEKILVLT